MTLPQRADPRKRPGRIADPRRLGHGLLAGLLALVLVGCTGGAVHAGPEVRFAADPGQPPAWTAWTFQSGNGICLQIRVAGEDPESICDVRGDDSITWRPDLAGGSLLAGVTGDKGAVSAGVTLADGSQVRGEVVPAAEITPLGLFVVAIPAGATAKQLDIQQADGTVTRSLPLQ